MIGSVEFHHGPANPLAFWQAGSVMFNSWSCMRLEERLCCWAVILVQHLCFPLFPPRLVARKKKNTSQSRSINNAWNNSIFSVSLPVHFPHRPRVTEEADCSERPWSPTEPGRYHDQLAGVPAQSQVIPPPPILFPQHPLRKWCNWKTNGPLCAMWYLFLFMSLCRLPQLQIYVSWSFFTSLAVITSSPPSPLTDTLQLPIEISPKINSVSTFT